MANIQQLKRLRPLGKLEQISATCHHLGFFNNVGLSAHYLLRTAAGAATTSADLRSLIYTAVGAVVRRHQILCAIPVNEDTPVPHFAALKTLDLKRSVKFLRRSKPGQSSERRESEGSEDNELDSILEEQHNTGFNSDGTLPFWRLIILEDTQLPKTPSFTASFIYHHAIGDGVSGLVFHRELRSALDAAFAASRNTQAQGTGPKTTLMVDDEASILPPLEALHPLPLPIPNPASADANSTLTQPQAASQKEWTGGPIQTPCKSHWSSFTLSPATSHAFVAECKARKRSVTAVLSSIVANALFDALSEKNVDVLTCIIPLNLRPWLSIPRDEAEGAIGTYFDATRARLVRAHTSNASDPKPKPGTGPGTEGPAGWDRAEQVSSALGSYLANTSPSGEPYTAIAAFLGIDDLGAVFQSLIGSPRDAAFEVTNVGLFEPASTPPPTTEEATTKSDSHWEISTVRLSRSAAVTGAAVTVSVATGGDGGLAIGFTWQEGVVEEDVVKRVKEGIRSCFGDTCENLVIR
ncbi:putative alcochol-O-acetyl transferase crmB [Aspergillus foveolatus]|uniref:putative alcochol-O-acetyl transferase crmB n=1 Tax=Aspergillus foveolatus TaxID=210207 RepID=UPI003CCD3892